RCFAPSLAGLLHQSRVVAAEAESVSLGHVIGRGARARSDRLFGGLFRREANIQDVAAVLDVLLNFQAFAVDPDRLLAIDLKADDACLVVYDDPGAFVAK